MNIDVDLDKKIPDILPKRERIAPEGLKLIKQTRSLCPSCLEIIDADVVVENDEVWMYKTCKKHGLFRIWIECDIGLYKKLMNKPPIDKIRYSTLTIPITHACNLNCNLCFVPKRTRDDLSLKSIKEIIRSFSGNKILLSGGEPTLRKDLPEIISYTRNVGKTPIIATNAVRLTDKDYLRTLRSAGLISVLFSINGLSEDPYTKINGVPLLSKKLKALENCFDVNGIRTIISPTVYRGVNENEVKPLLDLCVENIPKIDEFRIRQACRVGKYDRNLEPLSTYELFNLVASALGKSVQEFIDEMDTNKCYHATRQFNMIAFFNRSDNNFAGWTHGSFAKKIKRPYIELQQKISGSLRELRKTFKSLKINVWKWNDAYTYDFQEAYSTGITHLVNNSIVLPFAEAMLKAEEL